MSPRSRPGPPLPDQTSTSTAASPSKQSFPYLSSLNPAQHSAVISPPSTPLQILAGPGSGKTRVLTSRVAYLVQRHGYKPYEIVAVTFTNKAASEMRNRLRVLLGEKQADNLVLGTFHAMCARFLRRYGRHISLLNNFSITDSDDAKKTMSTLLKAKAEILQSAGMSLKEGAVLSEISKAKAKGETPEGMELRAMRDPNASTSTLTIIAELYAEYELALREANSLDFDDLLLFGLKLFTQVPEVLSFCKHILVDEFQDTNTTQYALMKCFANVNHGVSVVGDPDQSIYGWRSAEVENLNKMTEDFPGVQAIYLEQNYRSTGSILAAAHSVVSQDRERIQKTLYTSHPKSTPVTLKVFANPTIEASFIATEIKRLIAYSGGVLNYGDFAILLRYNALSRVLEAALQKENIPNRIVGGHKFFERMEIKDLLAYLQLAENPGFTPAFVRVINSPKRSIGDKSVADLLSAAKAAKISPMELCERITDGDTLPEGIRPAVKKSLATFVGIVRKLRRAADKGTAVADLLRLAIEKTNYEQYLRASYGPDFDSRWENVQELISFCVVVAEEQLREANNENLADPGFTPASSAAAEAAVQLDMKREAEEADRKVHPMFRRTSSSSSRSRSASVAVEERPAKKRKVSGGTMKGFKGVKEEVIEIEDSDDEIEMVNGTEGVEEDKSKMKPLTYFLQTSMLVTDTEQSKEGEGEEGKGKSSELKVTLTTVHAAKGLEWPVVFIPAVEQGTFPSYRCTEAAEIAEERRLLYVAMTRAQGFLTLSHCQFRMMGGEENDKSASEFVQLSVKTSPNLYSASLPDVNIAVRRNLAKMLERPNPDEKETEELIRKHVRAAPPLSMWDAPEPRDKQFNRFARRDVTKAARAADYWASEADEYDLSSVAAGFTSARTHNPGGSGSSRMSKPYANPGGVRSPPKPVVKFQTKHNLPSAIPFTFNSPALKKPGTELNDITSNSKDLLADMLSLGSDDPLAGTSLGLGAGGGKAVVNDWRSLSQPNRSSGASSLTPGLGGRTAGEASGSGGGDIQLAKGKKRLGMGRPAAWGTKK